MENITITNNNGIDTRTITIDVLRNTINAFTRSGPEYVCKLGTNKEYALKVNRTNISTCNVEYLAHVLNTNDKIFSVIYGYITGLVTCKECIEHFDINITRSQFYNSFNTDLESLIDFFKSATHDTRKTILADHICYNHEVKMNGIISMSTYVGQNKFCVARCNNCNNAICKYCYANSLTNQREGLKHKLIRLHAIFTNIELSIDDIPVLDSSMYPFFRFESFGDINNTIQINNYNLFALVNADINFTLWTKNPGIIQAAINADMVISDNLVIGLSSLYLNTPELGKAKKYSFIRFLFTVYDDNYIKEHNIVINCGSKHCITCGICYDYLHKYGNSGDIYIINERKK